MRRAAVSAREAGADPVIVVVGASAAAVGAVLEGLDGIRTVFNDRWESGLASSLAAGLAALNEDPACEAAIVMVADQPLVGVSSLRRLIGAFNDEHRIVASAYDDIVGVPVVFGAEHFGELMNLTGDQGAGRWLRARLTEVTQIVVAAASLDIDTPHDAARLTLPDTPEDS